MSLPVTSNDDALLFERFIAGNNDAFLALFRAYNSRLHLYCAKLIGSHVAAEDVVQELWERVVNLRLKPPRAVHNPVGFFLRIARNLCLDYLKSPRRRSVSFDELHESAHPVDRGEQLTDLEELALASLDRLSFESREVLVLNLYCGYRFDEIAEMLGKSPDAIWARASRARTQLRSIVAEAMASPNDGPAQRSSGNSSVEEAS